MLETFRKQIDNALSSIKINNRDIVVLKGIEVNSIYGYEISLTNIMNDKLSYFTKIVKDGKRYLTYDEFLALEVFINEQYDRVIIIENNMFSSFYPLCIRIEQPVLNNLCLHFDKDGETSDIDIGDLSKYVEIYANITKMSEDIFVVYNSRTTSLSTLQLPLWPENSSSIKTADDNGIVQAFSIYSEEDYLSFVSNIIKNREATFYVRIETDATTRDLFKNKLAILCTIFPKAQIFLARPISHRLLYQPRKEFCNILNKYWGYNEFRSINCYDLASLEEGSKKLVSISQEEIISILVDQVERCMSGQTFKDVFVTAPTGAGKSVLFQIPAIYLSQAHSLLTIVISPLIGLMNDQVQSLQIKNYNEARTINSDISPILKEEIIEEIKARKCNLLYISPETLLGRSDVEMLIGDRKIGLLVVDEAHIVTTWGKQFRPDYWYLGDHVAKLRKNQRERKGHSFVISTFTATSIYGGIENMYQDTKDSLNMYTPITYLGLVKRDNIKMFFDRSEKITGRDEYELRKFEQIETQIDRAIIENKRVLVYFPTVQLIKRFFDYCQSTDFAKYVAIYHGQLDRFEKADSYIDYISRKKTVMLATKAFGMGIDIDDIELVIHFAPTGNVCDYVQEIGRSARRRGLVGTAYYNFMSNDFKHINRLHGLSAIQHYQLIEVIRKILDLFKEKNSSSTYRRFTRRRNEILVDAASFSHVFENDFTDESNAINKVKTAMLIIQKDFETRQGFSPFFMRPIPLFSIGYFKIDSAAQNRITARFGNVLTQVEKESEFCAVNLKAIWESLVPKTISFAKFKFLLYSQSEEFDSALQSSLLPAMAVDVFPVDSFEIAYTKTIAHLEDMFLYFVQNAKFVTIKEISECLVTKLQVRESRSFSIANIIVASIKVFSREFLQTHAGKTFSARPLLSGEETYKFSSGIENYLTWLKRTKESIFKGLRDKTLFVVNTDKDTFCKEAHIVLGVLESFGLLSFQSIGGNNSQLSIYVNSTKTMKQIADSPQFYRNSFLERINLKHDISVEMLTFLYSKSTGSSDFWEYIENYFLGQIPDAVKISYEKTHGKPIPSY